MVKAKSSFSRSPKRRYNGGLFRQDDTINALTLPDDVCEGFRLSAAIGPGRLKHRQSQKGTREEIAALRGIIRQDREMGLFVSSGGFTAQAVAEAQNGAVHIRLIDLDTLLENWITHYDQLSEADRALLRLRPVFFLAPS